MCVSTIRHYWNHVSKGSFERRYESVVKQGYIKKHGAAPVLPPEVRG